MMVVREEERQRIFAEIHDEPLQRIFFINHLLDLVASATERGGGKAVQADILRAQEELKVAEEMLRETCQGIHPSLSAEKLSLAVKGVVQRFGETYDLPLAAEIQEDAAAVTPEQVAIICRIVSESLHNIVKHAQAESASVSVVWEEGMLHVEVTDDGQGAPAIGLTLNDLIRRGSSGILAMHDWAQHMGGELRLLANEPSGTRVTLHCPVHLRANATARALWA
jgi:two-component system, NarL family, nitrate/nitrite sensor histidine kinase NarX